MDNLDIIIYAALAVFLFTRLWSVLGEKDDAPPSLPKRINPFAPKGDHGADDEDVMVLEGKAKLLQSDALTESGHARTSLAGILDQIKILDPSFHEKSFIEGAKTAFKEIVTAFAIGDLSGVERFLGPGVLGPFREALRARKEAGQKLQNKIERIVAADIVAARLEGDVAVLTVEFVSYQTNLLVEETAPLASAPPTEEIRDRWVFKRDMRANDPNWQLVETLS